MSEGRKPSLATATVAGFLRARLGGDIHDVAPIGQGDWSQAFSFSCGGASLVARFGAYVEDFEKDRHAFEYSGPDLPVPRVLEIGEGLGGFFCLSERADGVLLDRQSPAEMRRLVPAVCRLFDALRRADIRATAGFGGWGASGDGSHATWQEFLRDVDTENERVHGWHAVLDDFPAERAAFDEGREYLKAHIALCPNARHLVHNDLLHHNVLVANGEIQAVVDWGCALYGDFLYDLAMFTFYAPWYPSMDGIDWETEARRHWESVGVAISHFTVRLRCCEVHLALGNMAYSAFARRPGDLADNARRLRTRLDFLHSPLFSL